MPNANFKEMPRDPLFNERIIWEGKPMHVRVPTVARLIALVGAVTSVISVLFAFVVARALGTSVSGMIVFAAWCATLSVLAWRIPLWWLSAARFVITEKHIIWQRGRIRRTMARDEISYARIRWSDSHLGDLTLVRAVPTGALRRTLTLTFAGVQAPDALWAIVRGVPGSATLGDGERPLGQRLEDGERVMWSDVPKASAWSAQRIGLSILSFAMLTASVRMITHAVPAIRRILHQGSIAPEVAGVLFLGVALGALLLVVTALGIGFWSIVRPLRLVHQTRYFVTDRRVLIRRGREELSLDRKRISYVIAADHKQTSDIFLVLDGPQARALAPSGAFDERQSGDTLMPVLASIEDAETAIEFLRPSESSFPKAA